MNQESLATPSVPRRSIAAIILSGKRYAFRVEGGITKGDLVKPPHPAEPERRSSRTPPKDDGLSGNGASAEAPAPKPAPTASQQPRQVRRKKKKRTSRR